MRLRGAAGSVRIYRGGVPGCHDGLYALTLSPLSKPSRSYHVVRTHLGSVVRLEPLFPIREPNHAPPTA